MVHGSWLAVFTFSPWWRAFRGCVMTMIGSYLNFAAQPPRRAVALYRQGREHHYFSRATLAITMAAPSNKPSPTQKSLDSSSTENVAATAGPKTTGEEAPVEEERTTTTTPTYESVQASMRYHVAQTLLQNGDFEDALTTIAEGLEELKEVLMGNEFHPALAPLHYLYGTTLLYSVEEASADAMMTAQPEPTTSEEAAEDAQIAFENLDLARIIVEQYLDGADKKSDDENNAAYNPSQLALDLAQIRLREGDLQRFNGQYAAALTDYQASLALRTQHMGPYDRKLADVHYNLGLCHALQVAEAASKQETAGGTNLKAPPAATDSEVPSAAAAAPIPPVAAAAAAANTDEVPTLTPAQREEGRRQSAHHYLECGRILCGHLTMAAQLDDAFLQNTDDQMDARQQLAAWRAHVQQHVAQPDPTLWDVLQEIQETLDEAAASEEGVQQVAHMKAAITAAAAAEKDDNDNTTNAFGSTAAAAVTATAQPLLAVRKKKRPPPSQDDAKPAPKQPKPSSE